MHANAAMAAAESEERMLRLKERRSKNGIKSE